MERVLLTLTAALGLGAFSVVAERRYHFIYEPKTFSEALSYCREEHTDMATVDDMDDVNTLISMADLSKMSYTEYSNRAWIGLYDDLNSWRWSLSDTRSYQTNGADFRRWNLNEPNNQNSGEHCTVMYDTGFWNDRTCTDSFKAICWDVTGPAVTFVSTDAPMSWSQAQNHCRSHYTDLASVRNMAENQEVAQLVAPGASAWIGLFRDSWKWLDGSNSSFRFWKKSEPRNTEKKETCAAADFSMSGQWEDFNCDYRKAFICYTVPKRVVKMKVLVQSLSLNLNEPAALEELLKQFKRILKDRGVNEDIKLSWNKQLDGNVFHKEEDVTKRGSI